MSPFLVQEGEMTDKNGTKKETLRLDLVGQSSSQYKDADIIIFNTGHWWTHDKTSKGYDMTLQLPFHCNGSFSTCILIDDWFLSSKIRGILVMKVD